MEKNIDPLVINIDVCGICNESCNYCPRSHGYPNIKEYMSLKMFKDFIDTVNDWGYTGFICWSGRGENSLHPDHSAMIKILHHKHRKYKTRILTNGYKWEKKKELLEMFDVMILNTYSTKEETARRKEAFPWADVRFWDQSVEPDEWEVTPIQIQNRNELFMGLKQKTVPLPCALPISRGWIHHDGSIQLCSNDWSDTNIFGNIKEDNFFDIWHNNPVLKQMKIDLAEGNRTKYKVCSSCNRKPTNKDLSRIKKRKWILKN